MAYCTDPSAGDQIASNWGKAVTKHPAIPASYTVCVEDGVYYALPCFDGGTKYSDTDASTVVQAAIDALPTSGGRIFIKKGLYTLTSTITIAKPYVQLIGESMNGSVPGEKGTYLYLADDSDCDVIHINGGNYALLQDFTVYANGAAQTGTLYGVHVWASYDVSIIRASIFAGKTACLYLGGSFGSYFHQMYCEYSPSGYGVRMAGSFENLFDMFDVYGNNSGGLFVYGACTHNIFLHGRYERCTAASAVGVRIRNSGATVPRYNQFIGGFYFGNARNGLTIEGGQYNQFVASTFQNNSQQANNTYDSVILQDGEAGVHSIGNVFVAPSIIDNLATITTTAKQSRYGIYEADANQDYTQIVGGYITGVGTQAILLQGANSHIDVSPVGLRYTNKGYNTGTGGQQTIAHGCNFTPTESNVFLSERITGGALAYLSAAPDSTNIYVTATAAKDYNWKVEI